MRNSKRRLGKCKNKTIFLFLMFEKKDLGYRPEIIKNKTEYSSSPNKPLSLIIILDDTAIKNYKCVVLNRHTQGGIFEFFNKYSFLLCSRVGLIRSTSEAIISYSYYSFMP